MNIKYQKVASHNTHDKPAPSIHIIHLPRGFQGALLTGLRGSCDAQSRWSRHHPEDSQRRLPLPSCLKGQTPQPQETKPQPEPTTSQSYNTTITTTTTTTTSE